MSWKDISKSSYQISTTKFTLPRSSHPFTIPYKGNKVVYNEGDELTHAQYPVFNTDFTQEPLGPDHFPCGYWHKNYIPPITTIYTSKLYPPLVQEVLNFTSEIIGGALNEVYSIYSYIESLTLNSSISSGILNSTHDTFDVGSDSLSFTSSISDGILDILDILYSEYTDWPPEGVTLTSSISSGTLDIAYISYLNWPEESLSLTSSITGGVHSNA